MHPVREREGAVSGEDVATQVTKIAGLLQAHRYRYSGEDGLHDAIKQIFAANGVEAADEVQIGAGDRIDFLAGSVGVEVKVAGQMAAVTRQLRRYAGSPQVEALILVTNRARHRSVPGELGGKPVHVVWLSGVTG